MSHSVRNQSRYTQMTKSDLFSEVQTCPHKKRSKHILGEINDYNYLV